MPACATAGRLYLHEERNDFCCVYMCEITREWTLSHCYIIIVHTLKLVLGERKRERELACVLAVSGGRESSVQPQSHFTDPHTQWKIVLSQTAGFGLSLSNMPIDSLCEWIKNMSLCRDYYPPLPIAHAVMMTANVLSNFCSCWATRISIGRTLWLGRKGPSLDPSSLSHPFQRYSSSVLKIFKKHILVNSLFEVFLWSNVWHIKYSLQISRLTVLGWLFFNIAK